MASDILSVDLRGKVEGGNGIEFLRAEINGAEATPFASSAMRWTVKSSGMVSVSTWTKPRSSIVRPILTKKR